MFDGTDPAALVSAKESRDGTKRIAGLVTMLMFAACLLPEIILEDGGWRAWIGSIAAAGMLLVLIGEIRAAVRLRRAERG